MSFHPDKCNVLRVTGMRSPERHSYQLKEQVLEEVSTAKYLGVDLSSDLQWKDHIDRVVKKAYNVLGFLRRNLRINNRDTKSAAYITMVRPQVEYCITVWSPHTAQAKQKLEMVQRRVAARYCTIRYHNTSSVTDMLQDLNWETLESRRTKLQLVLVDIPAESHLIPATGRTRARHSKKYRQYPTTPDTFKYSFFPRTISD